MKVCRTLSFWSTALPLPWFKCRSLRTPAERVRRCVRVVVVGVGVRACVRACVRFVCAVSVWVCGKMRGPTYAWIQERTHRRPRRQRRSLAWWYTFNNRTLAHRQPTARTHTARHCVIIKWPRNDSARQQRKLSSAQQHACVCIRVCTSTLVC